jgi:hypothetical protein
MPWQSTSDRDHPAPLYVICPRAECQTCKLFGHVAKDCVYANCLDVDVDWFNLLFTKSDTNMAATPIKISRVIEDDAIVKETIESTGGYRNNLCASCKPPSLPYRPPCRCGPYRNSRPPRATATATSHSERTLSYDVPTP